MESKNVELWDDSLESLPQEVYENIYGFLSGDDLLRMLEVSKRINHQIASSSNLMKKFKLRIEYEMSDYQDEEDYEEFFKDISSLQRVIYPNMSINFEGEYNDEDETSKTQMARFKSQVIEKFCSEVRYLEIEQQGDGMKISDIADMLSKFTKLETFYLGSFYDSEPKSEVDFNLPNLKSLILYRPWSSFLLKLRSSVNLKTFLCCKLSQSENSDDFDIATEIEDFLKNQNCLEELGIYSTEVHVLPHEMKAPVKRLSLINMESWSETCNHEFIKSMKSTLEELEMHGPFNEKTYEVVMNDLHNLKVLCFDVKCLPKKRMNIGPNPSIKTLHLRNCRPKKSGKLKVILGNLPNIEKLVIEQKYEKWTWPFIAANFPKLTSIHVPMMHAFTLENHEYSSLRELSLYQDRNLTTKGWEIITKATPNIEKFSIQTVKFRATFSPNNSGKIAAGWPKLSHVRIGDAVRPAIISQFVKKVKSLKILEISEASFNVENSTIKKQEIFNLFEANDGPRLIIHDSDDIPKIFRTKFRGVFEKQFDEEQVNQFYKDFPVTAMFDSDMSGSDIEMGRGFALGGLVGMIRYASEVNHHLGLGDSDSDSDYDPDNFVVFDSDGEPRLWDESAYLDDYFF